MMARTRYLVLVAASLLGSLPAAAIAQNAPAPDSLEGANAFDPAPPAPAAKLPPPAKPARPAPKASTKAPAKEAEEAKPKGAEAPPAVLQPGAEPTLAPETSAAVGSDTYAASTPNMIGDIFPPLATIITSSPQSPFVTTARVPATAAGAFKISDNDSPWPQDRVFFTYNYFSVPRTAVTTYAFGQPQTTWVDTNLHQQVVGVEKTFFNGYFSLELRLPFSQYQGGSGVQQVNTGNSTIAVPIGIGDDALVGDLTLLWKYVLFNWHDQFLFTGGMNTTLPTSQGTTAVTPAGFRPFNITSETTGFPKPGPNPNVPVSSFQVETLHTTLLQPWVGYLWRGDNFFFQGFTAVLVPTDWRDVSFIFNDLSFGYWLYRSPDRFISGVAPVAEIHLNTPLNHRGGSAEPIGYPDTLNMTGGLILNLGRSSTLTLGVATPVTGVRTFNMEGIAQFNWHF